MNTVGFTRARVAATRRMVMVVVVHGSNENSRLTMSTRSYHLSSSIVRFYMHFQRRITLLSQGWNEMDGWMDGWIWMVVVRTWSRSLRQVFLRFLHAWEGWRSEKANVMARGSWNIGNIVFRVEIVELLVEERFFFFFWKVSM